MAVALTAKSQSVELPTMALRSFVVPGLPLKADKGQGSPLSRCRWSRAAVAGCCFCNPSRIMTPHDTSSMWKSCMSDDPTLSRLGAATRTCRRAVECLLLRNETESRGGVMMSQKVALNKVSPETSTTIVILGSTLPHEGHSTSFVHMEGLDD